MYNNNLEKGGGTLKLFNHVAIITGAASGIGAAAAVRLAKQGVKPVLVDLNSCESTIAELSSIGCEYLEFQGDIRDESFVKKVVGETIEQLGAVHILVNNAGTCGRVGLDEMTEDIWDRDMDTNVKAARFFTKAVIHPHMVNNEYGRIINVSSVSGINGGVLSNVKGLKKGRSGPAYAASKGAVIAFTNWVAKEYGEYGITCNSVAPGATETGITKGMEYNLDQQVIKRIGTPEDIAEAICYFASPQSGYTTGQTLKVDGGVHIG